SGLRRGFLLEPARPPDPAPAPASPSANNAQKRKDPPQQAAPDGSRPPARAAKTSAADSIRRQAFPRSPHANELHAQHLVQLEKRRAADSKVAAFIDRLIRDLADLEASKAMNPNACRLLSAATDATLKLALSPGACATPEVLIKALRTFDPEKPASVDDIRLDARPSYATATRTARGQRYSRAAPPAPPIPSPPLAPLRPLQGFRLRGQKKGSAEEVAAAADSRMDDRIFARLSSQHAVRSQHSFFIKIRLTNALREAGAPADVGIDIIKHVPTGVSLRPSTTCTASQLYEYKDTIQKTLTADRVDLSCQWDRYVLMDVPCFIDGMQVPDDVLAEELEAALDCPLPEPPRRLGRPEALSKQRKSSVLFSLPRGRMPQCTGRLSLLAQRFSVRPYKEQKASETCDRCLSQHHTTAACKSLQPRCKACGVEGHDASSQDCRVAAAEPDSVHAIPLCHHCTGPHPAFSPGCYAAARYCKDVRAVAVPTGTRLARARRDGARRRQQEVARRRVAAIARTSRTAEEQAVHEEEEEARLLGLGGRTGAEGSGPRAMETG
ncbi:hypothetical protein OC834_007878, partial [Tilletia horrida]